MGGIGEGYFAFIFVDFGFILELDFCLGLLVSAKIPVVNHPQEEQLECLCTLGYSAFPYFLQLPWPLVSQPLSQRTLRHGGLVYLL